MNGTSNPEEASDDDKFKAIKELLDDKEIPALEKIYNMPDGWNKYIVYNINKRGDQGSSPSDKNNKITVEGISNSFINTLHHESIKQLKLKSDSFRIEAIDNRPGKLTERILNNCPSPPINIYHVNENQLRIKGTVDARIQTQNLYWMFGFVLYKVCKHGHEETVNFNFVTNAIYSCIKKHENNNIPTPPGDCKQTHDATSSHEATDSMSLTLIFAASNQAKLKDIQQPLSNAHTELLKNHEWLRYSPTSDNLEFSEDSSGNMYWLKIDLKQADLPKSINNRLDCTDLLESLIKNPGWVTAVQPGGSFDLGTSGLSKKGFTKA